MIERLVWDSDFFKRDIGILRQVPAGIGVLDKILADAGAEGFAYVHCRINAEDIRAVQSLEAAGFYIADITVTWRKDHPEASENEAGINTATVGDLPELLSISHGLFTLSRFYHDPFYTREEADAFYRKWIENSVSGTAADKVFFIKEAGFITCRKSDKCTGRIPIVGVSGGKRRQGYGQRLIKSALSWFAEEGISVVTVRTQAYNKEGMNFYRKAGFYVDSSDVVMAKIL